MNPRSAIAATYFNRHFVDEFGNKRFLSRYDDETITEVRETFLQKEQLAKLRTGLVTQLRQRLRGEFPELATYTLNSTYGLFPSAIAICR